MNKIKIVLSGKEYTIQTDESVGYVKQLAEALDAKIEEFMHQNDSISVTSACMLVALGLMDDCIKAASDKDNLRKQVISYLEEATTARATNAELQKQVETLKEQNELMNMRMMAAEGSHGSHGAQSGGHSGHGSGHGIVIDNTEAADEHKDDKDTKESINA